MEAAAHAHAEPIPAPTSVTLTDPVPTALARTTWLVAPDAADSAADMLLVRIPTDNDVSRLAPEIRPACPRTDVSDSHDVRSHDEPPSAACAEYAHGPSPPPRTVTLVDPVAAQLAPALELSHGASCDTPRVALLPRAPAVTRSARLLPRPASAWHRIAVSDSQELRSHALRPTLIDAV